jgi:hypothetical protein
MEWDWTRYLIDYNKNFNVDNKFFCIVSSLTLNWYYQGARLG